MILRAFGGAILLLIIVAIIDTKKISKKFYMFWIPVCILQIAILTFFAQSENEDILRVFLLQASSTDLILETLTVYISLLTLIVVLVKDWIKR